jgi:hypothetical protein
MPQPSKTCRHHLRPVWGDIFGVVTVAMESLLSLRSAALRAVSVRVLAAQSGDGGGKTSTARPILF